MKQIVSFEVVDKGERVFIEWDDGTWSQEKVFHVGEEGVLCDDLETYLEYADFEKV